MDQEGIASRGEEVRSEPVPVEKIPPEVQPSGSPDPVPIEQDESTEEEDQ